MDKTQLLSLINTTFEDGGENTAEELRNVLTEIVNANLNLAEANDQFVTGAIGLNSGLPNPGHVEGLMFYDNSKKAFSYFNEENETTINVGQEVVVRVINNTAGTISNGQAIRIVSAAGSLPSIVLAQADTVSNAVVSGVATHDIAPGGTGYITGVGTVDLDTSAWTEGDILALSATTPGGLVNEEQAINTLVAIVLDSAVNGKIWVRPSKTIDVTGVGQVTKAAGVITQSLTSVFEPVSAYENQVLPAVNVAGEFTASEDAFQAKLKPASVAASGFQRIDFSVQISSSSTANIEFRLHVNGNPVDLVGTVLMPSPPGNSASTSFFGFSDNPIQATDNLEMYVRSTSGSPTITYDSCLFAMTRLGNL